MENRNEDISNLDFISIKSSLVDFLNKQEEFKGYSFEGSALNVLMDLLSYNTYYNGIYNNLVMNESFLDTASKRSSIVSISKNLGYLPRSSKPAKAIINIKLPAQNYSLENIIIRRNTRVVGSEYSFVTKDLVKLEPYEYDQETGEVLTYAALNVEIVQGVYNTFSHIVTDPDVNITLPFSGIDSETIRAFVLNRISDTTGLTNEWIPAKNITTVNNESKIFFVSENPKGFYDIKFGDGVFGKKLNRGNVILFEFLLTNGSAGNDIGKNDNLNGNSSFSIPGYILETVQYSYGGSDREDAESIRKNALRNYSTQERAVTATDYEAIVLKSFPTVESVRCWGGEDNNPPEYGKVFASIKPFNASFLSAREKNNIKDYLMKNSSMVGMDIDIVDPDILYLNLNLNIKYDPSLTTDNETKIKDVIEDQVRNFATANYIGYDDDFYSSEFISEVLKYHTSIVGVSVTGMMEKRIYPTTGMSNNYKIEFENEIYHPESDYTIPSITSTSFYVAVKVGSSVLSKLCYLEDKNGIIKLYYFGTDPVTGKDIKIYVSDIGKINYKTGTVEFSLNLLNFSDDGNYISLIAKPSDTDIFTDRDTILSFERQSTRNINTEMKKVYKNTIQNSSSANRTYNSM